MEGNVLNCPLDLWQEILRTHKEEYYNQVTEALFHFVIANNCRNTR